MDASLWPLITARTVSLPHWLAPELRLEASGMLRGSILPTFEPRSTASAGYIRSQGESAADCMPDRFGVEVAIARDAMEKTQDKITRLRYESTKHPWISRSTPRSAACARGNIVAVTLPEYPLRSTSTRLSLPIDTVFRHDSILGVTDVDLRAGDTTIPRLYGVARRLKARLIGKVVSCGIGHSYGFDGVTVMPNRSNGGLDGFW
ncbi:hypothetical protein NUU61_004652 [Penicillium alfredii]|uniref:Uncharacterized protein n=1 Tax=Penicillium alfredii TaxID=1506179 RepID=A0A9W9FLK2_9EURO|nr:uncharacterized protein NUU61_004652 [Penicillium alfredii]KAJ5102430.1 hypothetical protein NUU61_004652 [Penicillium alfredii]